MQKELEEHIKSIHENFTIVDAHLDLLWDVEKRRRKGEKQIIETYHLPDFKEGGANIIVSSIYITEDYLPELGLRKALDQISAFYSELDESGDKIKFIKSYADVKDALDNKMIGILLFFEGVDPLMNDIGLLRLFYELGVRGVGITWSRRNFAGDGCSFSKIEDKKKRPFKIWRRSCNRSGKTWYDNRCKPFKRGGILGCYENHNKTCDSISFQLPSPPQNNEKLKR